VAGIVGGFVATLLQSLVQTGTTLGDGNVYVLTSILGAFVSA
jgi:uncharacterized membrane protein YeaQ/YmgE (transglycosylase-associated protein family)